MLYSRPVKGSKYEIEHLNSEKKAKIYIKKIKRITK